MKPTPGLVIKSHEYILVLLEYLVAVVNDDGQLEKFCLAHLDGKLRLVVGSTFGPAVLFDDGERAWISPESWIICDWGCKYVGRFEEMDPKGFQNPPEFYICKRFHKVLAKVEYKQPPLCRPMECIVGGHEAIHVLLPLSDLLNYVLECYQLDIKYGKSTGAEEILKVLE